MFEFIRDVLWFIYTIIQFLFKFLLWIIRYTITLSFLSTAVFMRYGIGKRAFLPWSVKLFGQEDQKYKMNWFKRLLIMPLIYLFVNLFSWMNKPYFYALVIVPFFEHESDINQIDKCWILNYFWGDIKRDFVALFDYDYFAIINFFQLILVNGEIENILNNIYIVLPKIYGLVLPLVVGLHLISFEVFGTKLRDPRNLGNSILFGWLRRFGINQMMIWCWVEPLFLILIGFLLYHKVGYELIAFPMFFWLSAFSMAFIAHDIRMKMRGNLEEFTGHKEWANVLYATPTMNVRDQDPKPKPKKWTWPRWSWLSKDKSISSPKINNLFDSWDGAKLP